MVLIVGIFSGVRWRPPWLSVPRPACAARRSRSATTFDSRRGRGVESVRWWLVDRTGNEITPAFLIMTAAAVSFLVIPLAAA